MLSETIKTSDIEGEFYSREDVISSIKKNRYLSIDNIKDNAARGIWESMLKDWHQILFKNSNFIKAGEFRTGEEPMVIVSGYYSKM